MKIGRNDACPCGSGKKHKKCCLNGSTGNTKSINQEFNLAAEIAYVGSIGDKRQKWSKEYISWKMRQLDGIQKAHETRAQDMKKEIRCSEGCCHCCSQFVGATLQECEGIVYWLYQRDAIRKRFVDEQYQSWRQSVREHESVLQSVLEGFSKVILKPLDESLQEALQNASEEYRHLDIPCPFLNENACSIYPVRPRTCAGLVSLSNPEYCKTANATTPEVLLSSPQGVEPDYFYGPRQAFHSPLPILVYEILKGGLTHISDLPGMSGLDMLVANEPEVMAVLMRFK